MASSYPLSVELQTPSGGHTLPLSSWSPVEWDTPGQGCHVPDASQGQGGTSWDVAVPSSPITVHRARIRVGESPPGQSSVVGQEAVSASSLSLTPFSKHPVSLSVPFGGREGRTPPLPLTLPRQQPHAASPATPQGRASGCQVAPEIRGQTSPRPSGRAVGSEAAGGRLAGVPRSWGSVGAKHLRDGSTHSATQSPSPPHSPCTPDLGMCLGRAPGPRPGQRRAVTVTRGSLFIVTNCRN